MAYAGKIVVVTGAGKGIGRSIARAYARHGARVVILDKDGERLAETEELLRQRGGESEAVVVDLSRPLEIEAAMRRIGDRFERLDVLINNAGLGIFKSPYLLSLEEWDYVLATNLRGSFLCSREAARLMRSNGGGSIVNIASTRALMSEPNSEAYAASKGGLLALTHALALSLGPDRIRVNAVSPGWIETGDYEQLQPIDHQQHPAGRVGRPEDIAQACLFLTDPANDFITGSNLVIDGGMTRKMIYL